MPSKKSKKGRVAKTGPVWHRSAEQATLDRMPKYNAHACGTGPHGDTKYNRARQKRTWQRETINEGARNRGRLPLSRAFVYSCSSIHSTSVSSTSNLISS